MMTNIIDLTFHHSHNVALTLQDCMAVSIDTCTALARSISWLWEDTREWVWVPPGFENPYPYPWGRCGFSWVWVQVALEYPRVTRDDP